MLSRCTDCESARRYVVV